MTKTSIAATFLSLLVAAGCDLGEVDIGSGAPPVGSDPTPKVAFDREVDPILVAKCVGCHETSPTNPNFVDRTAATAYAKITGMSAIVGDYSPNDAHILTTVIGGHNGVTYSTTEVGAITDWLTQEVAARHAQQPVTPGNPVGPAAIVAAEDAWSGCITLADFRSANMAQAWGNLETTDPQSACTTCHVTGGNDFIASDDEPVFFHYVTTKRKYMLQYFGVDTSQGVPKMVVNYTSFNQVSGGDVHHLEHPTFAFNNDGMQALTQLYDLALAKLAAGTCGGPTLIE